LGPLLFIIFINDIEQNIVSDKYIFADDTTLAKEYKNVPEVENILNADLKIISEWNLRMDVQWYVTFNIKKKVLMNFLLKTRKSTPSIIYDGVDFLDLKKEHKHLGMILSHDLKWTKLITQVVTKASQKLGALRRQVGYFSRANLETIYLNMIRPSLEYGSVIYSNCSAGDASRLDGVQGRASVLCSGDMRHTKSILLIGEMGWESLENKS